MSPEFAESIAKRLGVDLGMLFDTRAPRVLCDSCRSAIPEPPVRLPGSDDGGVRYERQSYRSEVNDRRRS